MKYEGLSRERKSEGVVDDENGESTQLDDVTGVGRAESELDRLGCGLRSEAGSWFQRQGEAHRKERSVTRNEDDVGGRKRVTRDEERVLR